MYPETIQLFFFNMFIAAAENFQYYHRYQVQQKLPADVEWSVESAFKKLKVLRDKIYGIKNMEAILSTGDCPDFAYTFAYFHRMMQYQDITLFDRTFFCI